jgi:hypothetical protein
VLIASARAAAVVSDRHGHRHDVVDAIEHCASVVDAIEHCASVVDVTERCASVVSVADDSGPSCLFSRLRLRTTQSVIARQR